MNNDYLAETGGKPGVLNSIDSGLINKGSLPQTFEFLAILVCLFCPASEFDCWIDCFDCPIFGGGTLPVLKNN